MIDRPWDKHDAVQTQILFQSMRLLPVDHYRVNVTHLKRPTPAQRGYLHGVVAPLAGMLLTETQGEIFDDTDTWEWIKRKLRPREVADPVTGELMLIGRSTKGMSRMQLFEFTDQLIGFLETANVPVPPPDPNYRLARMRAEKEMIDEALSHNARPAGREGAIR